jgi:hypothetical protein
MLPDVKTTRGWIRGIPLQSVAKSNKSYSMLKCPTRVNATHQSYQGIKEIINADDKRACAS